MIPQRTPHLVSSLLHGLARGASSAVYLALTGEALAVEFAKTGFQVVSNKYKHINFSDCI